MIFLNSWRLSLDCCMENLFNIVEALPGAMTILLEFSRFSIKKRLSSAEDTLHTWTEFLKEWNLGIISEKRRIESLTVIQRQDS